MKAGRFKILAKISVNSLFVTGFGEVILTGP
jgi:hypothetical protein